MINKVISNLLHTLFGTHIYWAIGNVPSWSTSVALRPVNQYMLCTHSQVWIAMRTGVYLADIFGRSVLLWAHAGHSWTTPPLDVFAQWQLHDATKHSKKAEWNILHSAIKGYSHAACSAHNLIITRALHALPITIGSPNFILRVLEMVWLLTYVTCVLLVEL